VVQRATIGVTLTDAEDLFPGGGTSIAPRLIDGNYPSVLQLIPASIQSTSCGEGHPAHVTQARQTTREGLDLVSATHDEGSLRRIRTQSHDAGDVEDNVDADYGGEEMTIAFNQVS